jgi:hypothetical protein
MLRVVQHREAGTFLERAESWLLEGEAENNILLSVAYLLEQGAKPFLEPAYLATIEDGNRVVGCAMRAPPDGVYLTEVPDGAMPAVATQLRASSAVLPEAIGPEAAAVEFAHCWSGRDWTLNSRFYQYKLEAVIAPRKAAPGALRLGTTADLPLLAVWAADYRSEIGSKADVVAFFTTMVERGLLHVWDDDGARSVVTASGLTPNGARISAAYTPPEFRGNAYATNAVAAVSLSILEGGRRFCVITADVADPVPNAIYRKIGFRPMGERVLIHFP